MLRRCCNPCALCVWLSPRRRALLHAPHPQLVPAAPYSYQEQVVIRLPKTCVAATTDFNTTAFAAGMASAATSAGAAVAPSDVDVTVACTEATATTTGGSGRRLSTVSSDLTVTGVVADLNPDEVLALRASDGLVQETLTSDAGGVLGGGTFTVVSVTSTVLLQSGESCGWVGGWVGGDVLGVRWGRGWAGCL